MMISGTALAFYGLGATAVATSAVKLGRRLQLSKAKHRSLAGHARMARRIAGLVPYYEYDESRFFCSAGAPAEIAAQRRDGFMRLAALYAERFRATSRLTAEVAGRISDVQFTDAYRGPFQYSRYVRRHLKIGTFLQSSAASPSRISTATASTTSPAPTASTCSATTPTRAPW